MMTLKRFATRLAGAFGLLLILTLLISTPVLAQDQPPRMGHVFYGSVTNSEDPVSAGTPIKAIVDGKEFSTTVDSAGCYGKTAAFNVSATGISDGTLIEFYIGETKAALFDVAADKMLASYPLKSGETTELDLSIISPLAAEAGGTYSVNPGATATLTGSASGGVHPYTFAWDLDDDGNYDDASTATATYTWATAGSYTIELKVTDSIENSTTAFATVNVSTPSGGGGFGGGLPITDQTITTNLFGKTGNRLINSSGVVQQSFEAASEDGGITLRLAENTKATVDGKPITELSVSVNNNPPAPPQGKTIVSAFEFGPSGATFNPALTLTIKIPPGMNGRDLVLAYYNNQSNSWEYVTGTVNADNTVTFAVSHFSTWVVLYPETTSPTPTATAVEPSPTAITPASPTATATPAHTTIPATVSATPSPTQTTVVTATSTTATTAAATSTPESVSSTVNWGMIGGILGAVAVIVVIIWIFLRKRTA